MSHPEDLSAYLHEQPDGSVIVDHPGGSARPNERRLITIEVCVPAAQEESLVAALKARIEDEPNLQIHGFRSGPDKD